LHLPLNNGCSRVVNHFGSSSSATTAKKHVNIERDKLGGNPGNPGNTTNNTTTTAAVTNHYQDDTEDDENESGKTI
jgi:hypothetical protein